MSRTEPASSRVPPTEHWKAARQALQLALTLTVVCSVPYAGWKLYKQHCAHEAGVWVADCAAINDPWQRFEKLALTKRPSLDESQDAWRQEQSKAALVSALQAGTPAAHDFVEPVASETVLDCLRYAAKALNADNELARLLESAHLPQPLTAAP